MAAPALGDPIPQSSTVKPVIKPYIPDYDISDVCFPGEREGCMGSRMYCIRSGWKSEGEPKKYSSPAECHSERVTKEASCFMSKNPITSPTTPSICLLAIANY
ncbi:hypothetical protein V2A60_008446 [Cordyceps javanica]